MTLFVVEIDIIDTHKYPPELDAHEAKEELGRRLIMSSIYAQHVQEGALKVSPLLYVEIVSVRKK